MAVTIEYPQDLLHVKPNIEGFNYEHASNKSSFEFDSGETFQKLNNRKVNDKVAFSLDFTYAEFKKFQDFFEITLKTGTQSFFWTHPIFQNRIIGKFLGGYQVSPQQGLNVRIIVNLEIIE